MTISDWQDAAAYDYFDALSDEGIMFEFARRDPQYRRDYQQLRDTGSDLKEVAPPGFGQRWGLRFRGRPGPRRPRGDLAARTPANDADPDRGDPDPGWPAVAIAA